MSVTWENSECEAYLKARDMPEGSEELQAFRWLRDALIWQLLVTKFPQGLGWEINEDNWERVYTRLKCYEIVENAYRQRNVEGRIVQQYIQPEEVHSFIGLRVNAGDSTDAEWRKQLHNLMLKRAENKLEEYHHDARQTEL